MKRVAILLILILLTAPAARATGLGPAGGYMSAFDPDAKWTEEAGGQLYVLKIDADTAVTLCVRNGELIAVSLTARQNAENLTGLARSVFGPTGGVSENALAHAIESGEPQLLGGARLIAVTGETRLGLYLVDADDGSLFWLPMHGGDRRHLNPTCSGMDVPYLASPEAADSLGFPPCSKCAGGVAESTAIDNAA